MTFLSNLKKRRCQDWLMRKPSTPDTSRFRERFREISPIEPPRPVRERQEGSKVRKSTAASSTIQRTSRIAEMWKAEDHQRTMAAGIQKSWPSHNELKSRMETAALWISSTDSRIRQDGEALLLPNNLYAPTYSFDHTNPALGPWSVRPIWNFQRFMNDRTKAMFQNDEGRKAPDTEAELRQHIFQWERYVSFGVHPDDGELNDAWIAARNERAAPSTGSQELPEEVTFEQRGALSVSEGSVLEDGASSETSTCNSILVQSTSDERDSLERIEHCDGDKSVTGPAFSFAILVAGSDRDTFYCTALSDSYGYDPPPPYRE